MGFQLSLQNCVLLSCLYQTTSFKRNVQREKVPVRVQEDGLAVLDNNFRVRGTTNLRVVDASVFPYILGFFIVTPVYMIAEKASDVLLSDAHKDFT